MASAGKEVAIVGGGCFWCVEAVYNQIKGVSSAVSGYAGGHVENPTYEQVCAKDTGHAEVVAVTFDPAAISYETILQVFFSIHDPTTPNRQGHDVGPQYRSVIMYNDDVQKATAEKVMKQVADEKIYDAPLVTELLPASKFYEAEKYHQEYYKNNPSQGYCAAVVGPKVNKFRAKWSHLLR
uniref:peptide-methionine (S)-S-oxide reductase n=1 Tax=Chlamydomonas leiostraca TaxID=1034604 RepID=A0A7S0RPG9_9CHLO|mmetsp:Transcript_27687/g.70530  ORF Transcript_27687/g.70530 Transcript_27687/m.70530 type:complete len:181 (+) Transcript_27687:208-750(+)